MINSFKTLFEARERKFQQERLFRGESVDLVAKITTDGVMDTLSSYSISGVYQPTDELSGPFYPMDAEIVDGEAILHWTNDNDFGRNAYNVWGLLTKDGKAAYPICWRLMFAHSPSYPLSSVDPIPRTIDFSQYELLNAPWIELSALGEIEEQVVLSALQAVDGRYLPLSGSVMEEDATIGFPASEDARIKIGKDGFQLMDLTTVETEAMSGWCWWSIVDPVPDYEIQWYTETEIANWDESTQGVKPWQNPRLRLCATKPASTETTETEKAKFQIPTDEEGDKTLATREWVQNDLPDLPYLPLSGDTVDGELSVTGDISAANFTAKLGVGINIGSNSISENGIAIGVNSTAIHGSVAIGNGVQSDGFFNTAIGTSSKATGSFGLAIGQNSEVSSDAVAVGQSAHATYAGSLALGHGTYALALNAIQLGSMASGPGAWSEQKNEVPHSLRVMDKMVLSGDNLTLDPERVPYLSNYAKTADIPEVPTDLSAFENSPGFATSAYVQEYVAEHAGTPADMSACLSSDEFTSVDFLSVDENKSIDLSVVSLVDIGNKINQMLAALKRMAIPDPPIDLTKTRVVYTDDSTAELDLTGNVLTSSIPNIANVKAISFGTNVTSLANDLFSGKTNLVSAEIPGTVAAVPQKCFSDCNNLASVTLHEGVTSIGREAIKPYHLVADQGKSVLTALTLPNSLTSLGYQGLAFCCFPTITLPKNLSNLGSSVFTYNNKLTAINVDPENTTFSSEDGVLYQGTTCMTVPVAKTGAVSIKEGTTALADACAAGAKCSSITLPSTLTTIGRYSSLGVSGNDPVGYSSLTIPSAVTSIGEYAFSGLTIPITMEGKTMAQVNSMSNHYWDTKRGASFICTDGTITR